MSKQILVLGMHRSGTSMVSRILNLMGCYYASEDQTVLPAEDNPKGFWERKDVMDLNNKILDDYKSSWDNPYNLKDIEIDKPKYLNQIKNIIYKLEPHRPWFIKDPRLCLTYNCWENVLENNINIFILRNPLEVSISLYKRNKINYTSGLALWDFYTDRLVKKLEKKKTVLCFYDHFLNDPYDASIILFNSLKKRKIKKLNKPLREEVENFVDRKLYRSKFNLNDKLFDKEISKFYLEKYNQLKILNSNFSIISQTFINTEQQSKTIETLNQTLTTKDQEIHNLNSTLTQRTEETEQQSKTIETLNQTLTTKDQEIHNLNSTLTQRTEETEQQSKTIETLNQTLTTKDQEIHNLNNNYNKLYEENIRLDSNINSLSHEYNKLFNNLTRSKYQILNPLYNNIYKLSGKILRIFFPNEKVDYLKELLFKNKSEIRKLDTKNFVTLNVIKNRELSDEEFLKRKGDIFIFSIIDWNFRFQRPQQLALQFSKLNRRIFFIEMTMNDDNTTVKEISDNLFKVNFSKKKIGFIQPYVEQINHEQTRKWLTEFFNFCESVQSTQFKHFVVQHPFWWQIVKNIPGSQINFDCMDHIKGFINSTDFLINQEEELVDKCDNLIVSSQFLKNQFNKSKNGAPIVRNGVNYQDFYERKKQFNLKKLINHKNKIKIGYVGAISDWFDFDLIKDVAVKQENFEFHLCGEVTSDEVNKIKALTNVHLYGEINYNDIASFLEKIDITIIPFKIIPLIQACDPVKIYEYAACQKPCVATNLPELFRLKDIVFLASNSNEFINQINNSYKKVNDKNFLKQLKDFAIDNSWENRAADFINAIDNFPLVSVIILSYGDPNLTINAIYSLFDKGMHYPNMEIIIVDNNSKDENLRKIKDFCKTYKNIRIIENEQNLGFAKGNNIGINQSNGEYILLLNNDTYVAPGAIFSMVVHLKNNKKIGVVGPLTNNIGNEAKLNVEYKDLHEMKKIAFDNTIFNRGNYTELNMVAYFAVMFRKIDFETFGLLSEDYGIGMFEDDDHCAMIKSKGNICALAEDAYIHHELSSSFSKIDENERKKNFENNKKIFESKWGNWLPHVYRSVNRKKN